MKESITVAHLQESHAVILYLSTHVVSKLQAIAANLKIISVAVTDQMAQNLASDFVGLYRIIP